MAVPPRPGKLDIATLGYIRGSTAQFAMTMTDAQYAAMVALATARDARGAEEIFDLKTHNCVHFVMAAAALVMGLTGLDHPELMKKPRSFLKAVSAANVRRVVALDEPGKAYLATLRPATGPPVPIIH